MNPIAAAEEALAADRSHADASLWITRTPDAELLARAAALEAEGQQGRPLWGVVVAVKDNIDVAGLPTTAGCPDFAYMPTRNATCVQRLLDAGAIVMGKTNLDQFATGLVGVRSPYGVPRNVFDATRVPGGSSSGSAMAVAAGIVPVALGTDTAGSGRVPAAFGNIVGLKPTVGSLSALGVVPACRSIDTVSVFARSVDQALAVTSVMCGYDAADPYSRAAPYPHLRRSAALVAPLVARVAVPDSMADAYAAAAAAFPGDVIEIDLFLAVARLLYEGPWVAERTAALREMLEQRPDSLLPVTRAILQSGFERRAVDGFDAFATVARARREATELFRRYDALLLPTTMPCPTLAEVANDPIGVNTRLGTWTNFVNLCDLAAITVPAGLGADGLPFSVTLVGPAWSEGRLASLADQIHRRFTTTSGATALPLPPPAVEIGLGGDEMALFCIGAHMSGLPLNHQIEDLGGRFLRVAHTRPNYRLYALGNRPGMVRVSQGGAAVAGEIWAMPTASIGALLAQLPRPLGFGSVALEDGPCLGFLAEAAGVEGATDITAHGGWRNWISADAWSRAAAPALG